MYDSDIHLNHSHLLCFIPPSLNKIISPFLNKIISHSEPLLCCLLSHTESHSNGQCERKEKEEVQDQKSPCMYAFRFRNILHINPVHQIHFAQPQSNATKLTKSPQRQHLHCCVPPSLCLERTSQTRVLSPLPSCPCPVRVRT